MNIKRKNGAIVLTDSNKHPFISRTGCETKISDVRKSMEIKLKTDKYKYNTTREINSCNTVFEQYEVHDI